MLHKAAIAILHFCLYFVKSTAFLLPGLTISKVYANTMLVILNNRIISGRLPSESLDNLDMPPRSPGGQSLNRCVFTVPSARQSTRAGGTSIIVTKDRLVFRLDPEINRAPALRSLSVDDSKSIKESVHSGNPIYVSPVLRSSPIWN